MKKIVLTLILLVAGIYFESIHKNHSDKVKALSPGLKENIPFNEVKPTSEVLQVKTIARDSIGYEELEETYQDLSLEELEQKLSELEIYSKKMNLFSLANSENRNDSTTLEITKFLRKDTVLRHMIIEQKLDKLEREYL